MTGEPNPSELAGLALRAARAGAEAILREARSNALRVDEKTGPADLVTSADHAAEAAIVRTILAERPDDAVLSEESGERPGDSGVRWVVDPLDGTTNFVYQRPDHAVSVAAEWEGAPVAGAILRPTDGAWMAAGGSERLAGEGATFGVTDTVDLGNALVGFDLPGEPEYRHPVHAFIDGLTGVVRDYRRSGSSACELLAVASGRQDAYLGFGNHRWDLAAGIVLVRAAGGRAERIRTAGGIDTIVAGTPAVVSALLALVERV